MMSFARLVGLYIPVIGLLAIVFLNYYHNKRFQGEPQLFLPSGEYTVFGRHCVESGITFDFEAPLPERAAQSSEVIRGLGYYDGNIDRKVLIEENNFIWIFGNTSCYVTELIEIKQNSGGVFSYGGMTTSKISPPGCSLNYTYQGKSYEDKILISPIDNDLSLSTDNLVKYRVYKRDELYLLYDESFNDYSEMGCDKQDRMVIMLQKTK